MLERTDTVWISDTNDPLQRQAIQRWTGLLQPPELMGSHVGAARGHVAGRTAELTFRLATALFTHAIRLHAVSPAGGSASLHLDRRPRGSSRRAIAER
jgi:alpha-galactosidase